MNSQRLGACTLLVIYINFAPVARPYLPHGRLPLFRFTCCSSLSSSLFLYPCVTNEFGSKVVKIKMGSTSRGRSLHELELSRNDEAEKRERKKSNQEVATKHFARLRCLWPKLKPQKVSGDSKGEKEKGLAPIRNAHIQLVI